MTLISVLTPSRGRPGLLAKSIQSLQESASDSKNFQVLVANDDDDLETWHSANKAGATILTQPRRGYVALYRYYNSLASIADGEFLMLWNDDAMMTTNEWDLKLAELPGSALVADIQHNLSPEFVCFPAIRRRAYEALGHFSGPTPHVDSWIQDWARATGTVRPVDVYVDHQRPDLSGFPADPTYLEGRDGLRHHEYFDPNGEVQRLLAEDVRKIQGLL